MPSENLKVLDSHFHGNDEKLQESRGFRRQPPAPSFPRRRESRTSGNGNIQKPSENLKVLDSRFRGNDENLVTVAIACATAKGLQQP
ncbi:hypothetical protein [Neisseria sp. LACPHL-SPEC-2024-00856]|uniref:hypothetical protein n=1 Tax=Neisseria sp. LACPHL-SPEC-2024-00856 TaxID=3391057 RepID=UPI003A4D4CEE